MFPTDRQPACGWEPFTGGIAEGKVRLYLDASGQNRSLAVEMFHLDGEVAASFLEPIRLVELVMRELIHKQVSDIYGTHWMLKSEVVDGRCFEKVTKSLERVGESASGNKIVSDLNLGFWAGLLQKGGPSATDANVTVSHRGTLWDPALSKVFRYSAPQRKTVANLVLKVSYLRNRIAHHEPILFGVAQSGSTKNGKQIKQEPLNTYGDLIQLANYMDPVLGDFLLENYRVIDLLSEGLMPIKFLIG